MVSNKDQQRQFEQSVISEMKPNLNKIRAHSTDEQTRERNKENKKEYYKNNKEQMNNKDKEYRKNNKEQIKEHNKEHYNKNKKSILEKGKIKMHCPYCDIHLTKQHIARHNKTKNHIKNIYFHYHNFIHS